MTEPLERLVRLCENYSILYAEDDSSTQEEVARTLRRIFKVVHLAQNGAHGLELFKQHRTDIVITDIQMPEKNGLDMAKGIKELSPQTPIIITTAFNDEHFFIKAIEAGVDAFLLKPIDKHKLYQTLFKIVGQIVYLEQTKELERVKLVEEVNYASEASVKNLANLFPFPTLFYQEGKLIFVNTTASQTLNASQIKHYSVENDFISAFDLSQKSKQKIKLPTSQGLHKIFWVYPNSLSIGSNESLVQAYIFVDITLLEYQKLKLSNYMLFMHDLRSHPKKSTSPEQKSLIAPTSKASVFISDDFLSYDDKAILRKVHFQKISAKEYIEELGDDYNHELEELSDTKDELKHLLFLLQEKRDITMLRPIADLMLGYAVAMEALFEFKDLGYALRSVSRFLLEMDMHENTYDVGKLSVFLSSMADDLAAWYYTVFVQQSTLDIHYLDSSLLSSCLQMEATFKGSFEDTLGDDLELF